VAGETRSLHLVNKDLLALLDRFAQMDHSLPLPESRAQMLALFTLQPPHPGVSRTEQLIPGPAGDLRLLVYQPPGSRSSRPALLHIHGGGYTRGAPEMGDEQNGELAARGCVVVSVAYRLAPEAPYPAAVEDCHAALVWLHAQADELKVDRARIGIVGESAGGGHAAALALMARDRGIVPLAFQWLIFPMIDDRTGVTSEPHPFAGEFVYTPELNRSGWQALLGREPGGTLPGPYAAAARAENLTGLPPTLIQTGALDLFVEENMEYARRLLRAGVPTELHVYPGAIHGYTLAQDSHASQATRRDGLDALKRVLGLKSVPSFDDIPKDINKLIGAHIKLYLTEPEKAHLWDARPLGLDGPVTTLLLTTVGRRSGEPRHAPLLYVEDGNGYLVIGSKGGNVDHPVWFMNLRENPECEIRVAALRTKARARVLEGEERNRAWEKITGRHRVYAKYQARAKREIPVVRLEPIVR
jgi:deazaflavin-dependent oxidoreductase (nitroreductase family)